MKELTVEISSIKEIVKGFLSKEEILLVITVDCIYNKKAFFSFHCKSNGSKDCFNEANICFDILTTKWFFYEKDYFYHTSSGVINQILVDINYSNNVRLFSASKDERTKFFNKVKKLNGETIKLETLCSILFDFSYDWNKFIND